jgi:hypothetical protein
MGFDDPLTRPGYFKVNVADLITRPTLSYVLRLWAEADDGQWVWRVSLTPIRTKHARDEAPLGFASLAEAVAYLQAETAKAGSDFSGGKR